MSKFKPSAYFTFIADTDEQMVNFNKNLKVTANNIHKLIHDAGILVKNIVNNEYLVKNTYKYATDGAIKKQINAVTDFTGLPKGIKQMIIEEVLMS